MDPISGGIALLSGLKASPTSALPPLNTSANSAPATSGASNNTATSGAGTGFQLSTLIFWGALAGIGYFAYKKLRG